LVNWGWYRRSWNHLFCQRLSSVFLGKYSAITLCNLIKSPPESSGGLLHIIN
jgi:hypothetical protein